MSYPSFPVDLAYVNNANEYWEDGSQLMLGSYKHMAEKL